MTEALRPSNLLGERMPFKKKEPERFDEVIRQNIRMEDIIKDQVERVCKSENVYEFKWGVKKLHALLDPYKDTKYPSDEEIEAAITAYDKGLVPNGRPGRDTWARFEQERAQLVEQYRYEYIFKLLNALARRLGIGLEIEGEEHI